MSKIDHVWNASTPPKPDVYTTRRNTSTYLTLRYWDGACWFEIAFGSSRGGTPFTWPKKSVSKRPAWAVRCKDHMRLRKISANIGAIQWGEPFRVYDKTEVLQWLVDTGGLPADWPTKYQAAMRCAKGGK